MTKFGAISQKAPEKNISEKEINLALWKKKINLKCEFHMKIKSKLAADQ